MAELLSKEAWQRVDEDPLSFLVDDAEALLQKHWERGPAVFRATPARVQLFEGLFSYAELLRLAAIAGEEGEALEFGVDVNAARYVDGRRETPNGELADPASIERLYSKEGCTMQFHQPQRFSDELWRLLAGLERQLGCLAGCNAYITPPGTQGLAPHYDDVEIFVVQTQGSKRWRLYRPAPGCGGATAAGGDLGRCHLANAASGDLAERDIGQPVLEVELQVGDVLYMPRGTIHQAAAQSLGSSHLTISTYQRWSAADAVQHAVSVALADPQLQPLLPQPLKAGLPRGFLAATAMGAADAADLAAAAGSVGPQPAAAAGGGGSGSRAALAAQLAAACRSLADALEDAELGQRLLVATGDAMAEDFMRSRLPPHPAQLPPRGPAPTLDDSVQCVGSCFFRLVALHASPHDGEGGCGSDCDEDHDHHDGHAGHADHDSEEEHDHEHVPGSGCCSPPAWVRLLSCLRNSRDTHMLGGGEEEEGSEEEEEKDEGSDSAGGSGSGSEMSSGEVDEWLPGINKAVADAAAAAGGKRKRVEPEAEVVGGSGSEGESSDESDSEEEGEEGESDGEGGEGEGQAPEDLVFPAEFGPALVQLLGTARDAAPTGGSARPLRVRDIALPAAELQLQLAAALWGAGVLTVVRQPPKQRLPQKKPKGGKAAGKQQRPQKQAAAGPGKKAKKQKH